MDNSRLPVFVDLRLWPARVWDIILFNCWIQLTTVYGETCLLYYILLLLLLLLFNGANIYVMFFTSALLLDYLCILALASKALRKVVTNARSLHLTFLLLICYVHLSFLVRSQLAPYDQSPREKTTPTGNTFHWEPCNQGYIYSACQF